MRIADSDTHLTIHLSPWEKLAGLHGDLCIPLGDITVASVDPHPMPTVVGRLKRGLRIPGYRYLATSDRGRHFIAVRHGEPALHLTLRGMRTREVTVSAPDAERLARRLADSPA